MVPKTKVEALEEKVAERLTNLSSCNEARRDGLKALKLRIGTLEESLRSLEDQRKSRMNRIFQELGLRWLPDKVNDRDPEVAKIVSISVNQFKVKRLILRQILIEI